LQGPATAYPADLGDVTGRLTKKVLPAGEVITKQVLEEALAVRKGEVVNISAQNKRLIVQTRGMALEKGREGDMVRVKSLSGKEIVARVTSGGNVTVEF
jgi:flagellar basal body P-ring formation protein FlgA